jgi:hypothetical protein
MKQMEAPDKDYVNALEPLVGYFSGDFPLGGSYDNQVNGICEFTHHY